MLNVSDGKLSTSTIIPLTITEVIDTPVAVDDYIQLSQNATTSFDVLLNDYTVEDKTLTLISHTDPEHGTLTFENGVFTYQATVGYSGSDSFTYIIGYDDISAQATVYLSVGGYFFPH